MYSSAVHTCTCTCNRANIRDIRTLYIIIIVHVTYVALKYALDLVSTAWLKMVQLSDSVCVCVCVCVSGDPGSASREGWTGGNSATV